MKERSEIIVETRARNYGQTRARVALGEHITLRIDDYSAGATLEMEPAPTIETSGRASPESALDSPASGQWPILPGSNGEPVDLGRINAAREGRSDVFGARWTSPARVRLLPDDQTLPTVTLSWDTRVLPSSVVWCAFGGDTAPPWYGTARLLAVEPMSMLPWDEKWRVLEPSEELTCTVRLEVEETRTS